MINHKDSSFVSEYSNCTPAGKNKKSKHKKRSGKAKEYVIAHGSVNDNNIH